MACLNKKIKGFIANLGAKYFDLLKRYKNCFDKIHLLYIIIFNFLQAFASFIVLLMKKAYKDKRYGQMKSDNSSKHDHLDHSDENSASYAGHKHCVIQTYPPGTIVRKQPTSQCHVPKVNSSSSSQTRRLSRNFCC